MPLSTNRIRSTVAAVVLAALLFGVTETLGRLSDAEANGIVFRRVTIPAAEFHATSSQWNYINNGYSLSMDTGIGDFAAHIPYDYPGTEHVFITYVQMYAYDNTVSGQACLALSRADPQFATDLYTGSACTVDSSASPQMVAFNPSTRRMNAGQRGYLWLHLSSTAAFFGARVTYIAAP